jgi:signal recognition particle subunit SRP54
MFETLSDRLGKVFDGLRGQKSLSEDDVNLAMREIRVALLEADVALPVVKDFVNSVKELAIGQDVIKSVSPAQQVVKIVNDALTAVLGGEAPEDVQLELNATPPLVYMMVGLQGSGKTTSTAKISKFLTEKKRKKILMASLDVQRPAAQEQLKVLGEQTNVDTLEIIKGQSPQEIAKRAVQEAKLGGYDIVFLDTAGRLSIDEALMQEVAEVRDIAQPSETLLVADAMTGQDAVNVAQNFNERIGITGIMLTRVDGDARGGAALSMRAVTGKAVKLLGTGEKLNEIELFHPERVAGRILGMGDVVSLVEKAVETIDQEDAAKMAEKFQKGEFDLEDFENQLKQMGKMGGMSSMLKMLPGLGKLTNQLSEAGIDDSAFKQQAAILSSMTKAEKKKPALMNASRKRRIALGSGTTVQDVNKLMKQFTQMQKMMKKVKKMGMGGMMKAMRGMMGGKNMDDLMGSMGGGDMDPAALEGMMNDPKMKKMMEEMGGDMPDMGALGGGNTGGGLGPNPFAGGGTPDMGGLSDIQKLLGEAGMGGGLPGLPARGGTKKNRKKKR